MDQNSFYQLQALLKRTGSVSIPNIGTFYRTHKPALVHAEKGLISPPSEAISFKKEVDPSVLFSKHLTEAQFLHHETSEQLEAEFSSYLRRQLRLDRKVSLPKLGLLHLTSDGQLTFTSFKIDNNRSDDYHFGLKPIKLPNKPKSSGIPEITMSSINNGIPTYETTRKPSPIKWQPYLLVGILVLVGVLVIYNGPFLKSNVAEAGVTINEERTTPFQEAYPDANSIDKNVIASSEKPVQRTTTEKAPVTPSQSTSVQSQQTTRALPKEQKSRGAKEVSKEVVILDMSTDGKLSSLKPEANIPKTFLDPSSTVYHLISASFTQLSKAEGFAADMKGEGFRTKIILPGDGPSQIHRVSIFQSNELTQVKDVQRQLENVGKKLLWIYHAGPVQ